MAQKKKTGAARSRKVTAPVRHGATILQSHRPRRIDVHVAPPRLVERRHARPGSGIKARAVMLPKRPSRPS
jgi:hypothetical protein